MAKKYIDAELLRKEIESRMRDCDANSKNPNQLLWAELAALIPFLDSLQQEQTCDTCTNDKGCVTCKDGELWEGKEQPSEDLEKAADEYSNENEYMEVGFCVEPIYIGHKTEKAFIAGAEWQKSQMIRDCSVQASYEAEIEKAEERGYNLCKEQMLKEAVEGLICATITGTDAISFLSPLPKELTAGDRVKIVIVKEDKE